MTSSGRSRGSRDIQIASKTSCDIHKFGVRQVPHETSSRTSSASGDIHPTGKYLIVQPQRRFAPNSGCSVGAERRT